MYYAARIGIDRLRTYGLPPTTKSSHYQRKVRRKLNIYTTEGIYELKCAGRDRKVVGRQEITVHTCPPHELFNEDKDSVAAAVVKLDALKASGDLPPAYRSNRIVQEHPDEPLLPLGLFVDATPYSLVDSVLRFWTVCLLTGRRWISVSIRKKVCCKCGCRGGARTVHFSLITVEISVLRTGAWEVGV